MKSANRRITCRLCEQKNLIEAINLGKSPLANQFLFKKKKVPKYTLKVMQCKNCNHLQLSHVINKSKLFSKYLFVSGTSPTNLLHFKKYAKECSEKFIKGKSKILDIASNDGSFLQYFSKNNIRVGIDPAKNIFNLAKKKKIYVENKFFCYSESKNLKKKYGPFDLITANNVCAHVDQLKDFIKGVKNILTLGGTFVFEVGYFGDVYKNKTFDTIYHEHLDYHLFTPLINFFKKMNLEIFDAKNIFIQGGSLRIYVSHKGKKKINKKNINKLIFKEKKMNYSDKKVFLKYQEYIDNTKKKLKIKLNDLINKNHKIAGYGASAKSTTLLNYFGINDRHLEFIADLSRLKQNKYTPGSNIKILPVKQILNLKPDFVLILAWNFFKEIIIQNKEYLKQGGKFITPFPKINTITYKNYKKFLLK